MSDRDRYRALLDHLPLGVAVYEVVGGGEDFVFADFNRHAEGIESTRREDLIGRSVRDCFPGVVEFGLFEVFQRVHRTGEPENHPITLYADDRIQGWRENLVFRSPTGEIVAIYEDATARKQAEEALRESELRHRALSELTSDLAYAFRVDGDGHLHLDWASDALGAITGYTADEIRERGGWSTLVVEEDRPVLDEQESRLLAGVTAQVEYRIVHRDGRPHRVRDLGRALLDDAGQRVVRVIGAIHDITEQHALEEQVRRMQKMEAVGTLAGGLAHDFNNLLVGILGHAELLAAHAPADSEAQESARVIRDAAGRAADLTRQLLGFARKGKLRDTAVDLREVVRDAVAILGHTVDRRTVLRQDLERCPAVVKGDPVQLQQVVINLAVNAIQAIDGPGEVCFRTRRDRGAAEGDDEIVLEVVDTGCGIEPAVLERIFEPFFTTRDPGEGTGMGLATVYGIVRNHGGHIGVDSEPGTGSTFRVRLPAHAGPPVSAEAPRPVTAGRPTGRGRLLLVDDEEVVRDTVARMLERLGYTITLAVDGQDALERFAAGDRAFDLVILDINMPRLDGSECFEALRALDPSVRVLIATGYGLDGAVQELLDRGASGYVAKPFDMAGLAGAVDDALGA